MRTEYILNLQEAGRSAGIGRKAENLRFLARKGFPTPATLVCTWQAHERYLRDDVEIVDALRAELAAHLDMGIKYAVRSSADVEDGLNSSFAGQFKSVLDVNGVDEVLRAIWAVWATARSPGVEAYRGQTRQGDGVSMAVILQEMVSPLVSGVAFSKNPVTGLDEVLVETVRGSGAALVQEGVTPERWVNKWGTWVTTPPPHDDGQAIDLALAGEVVRQTRAIARAYGRPVDLEWVYDGQQIWWVQLREITALDVPIYSNRISREVFPGIINPLVWSVNMPLVNGAWVVLLTELIGPNDIEPESLAGYFYSRAYFNMGALGRVFALMGMPRESLELLMGIEVEGPERPSFRPSAGSLALLPRMLRFAAAKSRFAGRVEDCLATMPAAFRAFGGRALDGLSEAELLAEVDCLCALVQETAYYNIVTPLLMQVYNRLLSGQLARAGVDFASLDLTAGMAELEQYDPNPHLARLHELYAALDDELQAGLRAGGEQALAALPRAGPLRRGIEGFLEQFGHLSDSGNDFTIEPWRENPGLVLSMVAAYTPPAAGAGGKVGFSGLKLGRARRPLARLAYRRARQFRYYREAVSSLYTYGYGLFRDYFLALGERFARRGVVDRRDDVFYLYLDEVREIVADQGAGDRRSLVRERRDEVERARPVVPPDLIFGDQAPPLPATAAGREGLRGIPTSRGHHTGPARVVASIQDLPRVQAGDVLVIPYSDVGWTPLFTRAGAVVAESGGILSHSSIVAREYGIPAVVSVPGACLIPDGTLLTVDGYRGEVVVHDSAPPPEIAMRIEEQW